MGNQPVHDSPI